jgi:hypothetical protein
LLACVRDTLNIQSGAIPEAAAAALTALECQNRGISNLAGLDKFTGLKDLSLWQNSITSIAALSTLTNLEYLQLGNNQISSLSALSGLTKLKGLGLYGNAVTSVSSLSTLTNLEWLNLDQNNISSISAITGLPKLYWLTLRGNPAQTATVPSTIEKYVLLPGSGQAPVLPLPTAPRRASLVSPDELRWQRDQNGEVRFTCHAGDASFDAVFERDGSLFYKNGVFFLVKDGEARAVGVGAEEQWELCSDVFACDFNFRVKLPEAEDQARGQFAPVCIVSLTLKAPKASKAGLVDLTADDDLLPYTLASPNQYDAGSCLFMANTGAMEIVLNVFQNNASPTYNGQTDLSERYLMSASDLVPSSQFNYVITDVAYTFNYFGGALKNSIYPFTAALDGSYYSCQINWTNELPSNWQTQLVPTPGVDRTVVFIDPTFDQNSIWDVGVAPRNVVNRIKWELRTKNTPVIVVYNEYMYWHATVIVGYDDNANVGDCPVVRQSMSYFTSNGRDDWTKKIQAHMNTQGGCQTKGAFLVRDSIYDGGSAEPTYNYGGSGFSAKYSKRIIQQPYDWLVYLGNHAYTIHRN